MYTYSIKATDAFGNQKVFEVQAKDHHAAFELMRTKGFEAQTENILKARKHTMISWMANFLEKTSIFAVSKKEINRLIKMIGNALFRGKTLKQSLEFIGENEDSKRLKKLINRLREALKKPFASQVEIFQSFPNYFEDEFLGIVEAGESSSNLGQYMMDYVQQKEKQAGLNTHFKVTLTKRFITFLTIIAVTLVVVLFVIPQFENLFGDELNIPWAMQMLVNGSDFLKQYGPSIVLVFLMTISTFTYLIIKHKKVRWWWHDTILHFPILGPTLKTYYTAQLAYFLSTLLTKNVDIIKAMNIVIRQAKNVCLVHTYKSLIRSMKAGDDLFSAIIKESERGRSYLISSIVQAAKVGSETATLGETLMDVRNDLDILLEVRLKRSIKLFSIIFYSLIVLMAAFIAYAIGSAVIVFYENAQNLI